MIGGIVLAGKKWISYSEMKEEEIDEKSNKLESSKKDNKWHLMLI